MSSHTHSTIPESHYDILESCCYPVVCTMRPDGLMSANPVSMLWDGEFIRFSTLKNRMKYRNLLSDPRLSLCLVHPNNPMHYLEVRGRAELEEDSDRAFVNRIAIKYMGRDVYPYDPPDAQRITVKIIAQQISTPAMGKFASKKG